MKRALPSRAVATFMKYSLIFSLLLSVAGVSWATTSKAQNIDEIRMSVNFDNVLITDAFAEIEQRTGMSILYFDGVFNKSRKVTIAADQRTVREVLGLLLASSNIEIRQSGQRIVLSRRAAPGIIRGRLTDSETDEVLIGAYVTIPGTSLGSTSDVSGNYQIGNVPEGVYSLRISYIGYSPTDVPSVQVTQGTTTVVNVKLHPASSNLEEVVVTARPDVVLENSTDRSVLSEMRSTNNIVTGISSEQISRTLDRDAAEVVRRATGVTIADDRFVLIRGLEPRYTLTLLNDLPTPSAESDRRSFSYDMINSSNIDRVMVYKMPTADLPADFAGGVVKVYTKSSANTKQLNIQLSTQFRPGSSFSKYDTYEGGKYDGLGFDDGARAMPAVVPGPEAFPVPGTPETSAENARLGRSFNNNWNVIRKNSNLDKRAVISYYTSWPIGKGVFNSLSSVSYTYTTNINETQRLFGFNEYTENGTPTGNHLHKPVDIWNSTIRDVSATESARVTAMQNFKWVVNDKTSLEFKNFFNVLGRDRVTRRDNRNSRDDIGVYVNTVNHSVLYNFRSRALYTAALSGEHNAVGWLSAINWRLGYGYTSDQQPDYKGVSMTRREPLAGFGDDYTADPPSVYQVFVPNLKNNTYMFRGYNSLNENSYTAAVDLSKVFKSGLTAKAGMFTDYKARDFVNRQFGFYSDNGPLLTDKELISPKDDLPYIANTIFDRKYFRNDGAGYHVRDNSGGQQADEGIYLYKYQANNRQHAAYGLVTVPLLDDKLTAYAGLRVEWNRFEYPGDFKVIDDRETISIRISEQKTYALPSAMVTYKVSDKFQIRGGYGKSLNRPEFREAAPIRFVDFDRNISFLGNYKLTNAEIDNYDVRWEFYPKGDELISVGAYYKTFRNAIELFSIAASGQGDEYFPINTARAIGYGVEFELRKRLDFIPMALFRNFGFNANVTLLKTEIDISKELASTGNYNELRRSKRPLQGASPYAINASLYYENKKIGTQITALYNVIGQRLYAVGNSFSAELYEMPRSVLDLTITQSVGDNVKIRAGVQDILNQPYRIYRDRDRSGTYNPEHLVTTSLTTGYIRDYMEEAYSAGSYYSLGVLLSF